MSNKTNVEIVEEVYLKSYEELRKEGKDEEEAYAFAMKLSTAVHLVIQSRVALRAILLYLQSSDLHDRDDDLHSAEASTNDDESSLSSEEEQDNCHVIPMS
jgi:hypothetical protein